MNKIKNIEFLRIIGCLSVILFHFFCKYNPVNIHTDINFYTYFYQITHNGNKAVELFFILSGVFFAITYKSNLNILDFIKKKIIRFSPVLIFSVCLAFIFSIFKCVKFKYYNNLLGILFLNGTPLSLCNDNITTDWYIGALFWTLLLFFYVKQNFQEKYINIFFVIGIFISYSIIIHFGKGVISHTWQDFHNMINFGILRAFGGIGIGYFIGEWYRTNYDKIKNLVICTKYKFIITVIEILCVGFIIKNLMFYNLKFENQIIYVIVFAITIILFLLNQGYLSKYLNRDIFVNLSKYTYSLFIMHYIIIRGIYGYISKNYPNIIYTHPILNMLFTLTIVFVVGILTYHFIELPSAKYLKNKFIKN